jgi:hypothetical protein
MPADHRKGQFRITDQELSRTTFWLSLASVVLFAMGCAAVLWNAIGNEAVYLPDFSLVGQ